MLDRVYHVYSGNNFEVNEAYSSHKFHMYWERGAIETRPMPCPTRRHPERTKMVYVWVGENGADVRDKSAQMGPRVIEGNAAGIGLYVAIVKEWGRNRLVANPIPA